MVKDLKFRDKSGGREANIREGPLPLLVIKIEDFFNNIDNISFQDFHFQGFFFH